MGLRGHRAIDPTPEEIAKRAELIRQGWTKKETRIRGTETRVYSVPVFSPKELMMSSPRVRLHMD